VASGAPLHLHAKPCRKSKLTALAASPRLLQLPLTSIVLLRMTRIVVSAAARKRGRCAATMRRLRKQRQRQRPCAGRRSRGSASLWQLRSRSRFVVCHSSLLAVSTLCLRGFREKAGLGETEICAIDQHKFTVCLITRMLHSLCCVHLYCSYICCRSFNHRRLTPKLLAAASPESTFTTSIHVTIVSVHSRSLTRPGWAAWEPVAVAIDSSKQQRLRIAAPARGSWRLQPLHSRSQQQQ